MEEQNMMQKYGMQAGAFIAGLAIVVVFGMVVTSQKDTQEPIQEQESELPATSTNTALETTTDEAPEEVEQEVTTKENKESKPAVLQEAVTEVAPGTQTSNEEEPKVILLGERKPADSPRAALDYFVEAMNARDFARAASYFSPEQQEQRQKYFEEEYPSGKHVIVNSYNLAGEIADVELVDEKYGIYEIAVYAPGAKLPFRTRYAFSAEQQEFVILEL